MISPAAERPETPTPERERPADPHRRAHSDGVIRQLNYAMDLLHEARPDLTPDTLVKINNAYNAIRVARDFPDLGEPTPSKG